MRRLHEELERGEMVARHLGGENSESIKLFEPTGGDEISPAVFLVTHAFSRHCLACTGRTQLFPFSSSLSLTLTGNAEIKRAFGSNF
jgi:hypothetical protein